MTGIDRHGADFSTQLFEAQCKVRRGQPSYLRDWLSGIVATAKAKGRIGIVIWKDAGKGKPDDEALVILRLRDWQDLHGNPQDGEK